MRPMTLINRSLLCLSIGSLGIITANHASSQTRVTDMEASRVVRYEAEYKISDPRADGEYQERNAHYIQVALLLDTSSSMDGLINQAKSQLWSLVNELSEGRRGGHAPHLELSLYEYGNNNLSISDGYIRQVLPLTSDLDRVSEALFDLSTNGGSEYAGQVIDTALKELEWSRFDDDLKLVIIAGNEPFTQGPVSYQTACRRARAQGVIIDTIHCGNSQQGISGKWKAGADCGGGIYMTINQDAQTVHIDSPYDDQILKLNGRLNETYLAYGTQGKERAARQMAQDDNAAEYSVGSAISRAKSKASKLYKNESWDAVDAYAAAPQSILELDEAQMPDEMKGLDSEQRAVFIEEKTQERKEIQAQISDLEKQRKAYIAQERKTLAKTETLDNVMVKAVRDQAISKGFDFSKTN